ncbi:MULTISPECIES: sensor histidine kinase [Sphingomonas]|jgi:PAS domain S-box-containing protein|nr:MULTISPECIES: ATP-binding protein [Sphingomonas]MBA2918278.1 PAS domain S-box protein [Sphingomonas sp. CGMCC 1.13658]
MIADPADDTHVAAEIAERTAELEQAQAQLRESEELYRHVVELSSLIPWTADGRGQLLAVGERFRDWTGAAPREALGNGWLDFVHPQEVERLHEAWMQAVWSGRRFEREWRMRDAEGGYRWCHARASKREDQAAGKVVWYGTLEDVQERHDAEEAYRRAQADLARVSRLSAMGVMASAIAHDINQPLTAIAQYVRGCKRLLDRIDGAGKPDLARGLEEADQNTVRASEIVRRVREFVTRGTIETRRENLHALIDEACGFAMNDPAAAGVTCRVQAEGECFVFADRIQIRQVLINLIRNAVAAMEDLPRRIITVGASPGAPGYCEVSVSDTGPGIPPEAVPRLFETLYTTRPNGMGVGLPICRMIVEAHGGSIWTDTDAGPGATMRFTLPTARAPEAAG